MQDTPPPGTAGVVPAAPMLINNGTGWCDGFDASTFDWLTHGSEDDAAGIVAADLNRDGRKGIVIGAHYNSVYWETGTMDPGQTVAARLYLNRGNDVSWVPPFEDVTDAAGLVPLDAKSPHTDVADFDSDGWLDIVAYGSTVASPTPEKVVPSTHSGGPAVVIPAQCEGGVPT